VIPYDRPATGRGIDENNAAWASDAMTLTARAWADLKW